MASIQKVKTFARTYDSYTGEGTHSRFSEEIEDKMNQFITQGWKIKEFKTEVSKTEKKAHFMAIFILTKKTITEEKPKDNSIKNA